MGLNFDPKHDPLETLVPQFEPKLKVPKLIHDGPACELNAAVDDSSYAFHNRCSPVQCPEGRTRFGRRSGKLSCKGHL